jgi:hypothetical protein
MLRRHPVVHGGDEEPQVPRQVTAQGVVLRGGPHDVATTVDPQHRRERLGCPGRLAQWRAVQADRHLARPVDLDIGPRRATTLQGLEHPHHAQRTWSEGGTWQHRGDPPEFGVDGVVHEGEGR